MAEGEEEGVMFMWLCDGRSWNWKGKRKMELMILQWKREERVEKESDEETRQEAKEGHWLWCLKKGSEKREGGR